MSYFGASPSVLDISRGVISGASTVQKFGANSQTPSGTERDVWEYGATGSGNIDYNWLTATTTVRIASGGDANDTAAGSGAQSVTIVGLDSNWDEATETVATAGASASSATSTSFIRVYRAYVADVGTYTGANAGAITIENSAGGTALAYIGAGLGQSQLTMYTVPNGYTAYMNYAAATVAVGTNKEATLRMFRRENADDVSTPFSGKRLVHQWKDVAGVVDSFFDSAVSFPEKTDLWWTANANAVAAVSIHYDLVLFS